jgi:hypothetical protein
VEFSGECMRKVGGCAETNFMPMLLLLLDIWPLLLKLETVVDADEKST